MQVRGGSLGGCVAVMSLGLAGSALATVTPTTLFGDSYIVVDGSRTFSVLDVYIKCGNTADIISSVFGVSAYTSAFTQNQGRCFEHDCSPCTTACWLPTSSTTKEWDSFVTCGARVQGPSTTLAGGTAGFLGLQLDTNWAPASSCCLMIGQAGGLGWYPSIGASTSSNPYCRGGYNGGVSTTVGYWNTAKCTTTIPGNGIVPGQSLSNYWMIGRFSIDVSNDRPSDVFTFTGKCAIAGKQNGTTTFTGSANAAGRLNYTLTYASVPTCSLPTCPADLDGNRVVDTADVGLMLLDFGPCPGCQTDFDGNGVVDTADVSLLLLDFGDCAPCPCWYGCS